MGLRISGITIYGAWIVISKFINEKYGIVKPTAWRVGQWFTTRTCIDTWLSHDMALIASFFIRNYFRLIDIYLCVIISITILCVL